MAVIGGKLYSNHPKNMNHVHKDTKDMVSVIITVVKDISRGGSVFYDGLKTSDFGSRAHILKHLHGRIIFGTFEKVFREGTLWSGYRAIIYFILTKKIFLHLFFHGDRFCNRYINTTYLLNYRDYDGTGEKTEHFLQRRIRYTYGGDTIQGKWYRDRKIARDNFGRKKINWIYLSSWVKIL